MSRGFLAGEPGLTSAGPPYRLGDMNRAEAEKMMTDLLKEHRLYEQGWRFHWMSRRNTYGLCRYGYKRLQLSTLFVDHNNEDKVLEVCRHEVAHALAGYEAAHGPEWQAIAIQLGVVNPRSCTDGAELPPARYQATCPSCKKLYSKTRAPKLVRDGRFYYCPPCWKSTTHLEFSVRRASAELVYVDTFSQSVSQEPVKEPVSAAQSTVSVALQRISESAPNERTELLQDSEGKVVWFKAPQVARAMGVDPKQFRAWLRKWEMADRYQSGPGGSYSFTSAEVKDVIAAWNATH